MMRSVVFYGIGDVRLVDTPLPEPGAGEAVLRIVLAGMCATDRHIVAGHFSVPPPRILGHELVGLVEVVGPGVDPAWVGRLCGVRPARFCGQCPQCRSGASQLCQNFECLGNTHDGGYAEYALVRSNQLVPLDSLAPETGIWLEPLACVLQAIARLGGNQLAGPVLVIGAGVLGKLLVMALQASAQVSVAIVDPNQAKVNAALELGAQAGWVVPRQGTAHLDTADLNRWAPQGIPTIIDTTGSPAAIQRALEWTSPGGKVLLFGVSDPAALLTLSPFQVFTKELTLLASSGMSEESFAASVAMLQSGRIDPRRLISTRIELAQLPAYLRGDVPSPDGKVVVTPHPLTEAQR